ISSSHPAEQLEKCSTGGLNSCRGLASPCGLGVLSPDSGPSIFTQGTAHVGFRPERGCTSTRMVKRTAPRYGHSTNPVDLDTAPLRSSSGCARPKHTIHR